MIPIEMTETYTCGEATFRRGKKYEVTDARAKQLIGRGSARLVTATAPPAPESSDNPPSGSPDDGEPPAAGDDTKPSAPKPSGKAKPAPKPTK